MASQQNDEVEATPQGPADANLFADQPPPVAPPQPFIPPPPSRQIILCKCSDDVVVEVPANYLRVSKFFDGMFRNLGLDEEEESVDSGDANAWTDEELDVANVSSEVMTKVADWCANHAGLPEPVIELTEMYERKRFDFTDFEQRFLDVSVPELVELINAANYLDIPSLFIYGCQKGAMMMEGKSCEEVRAEWGFPDDLSEAQKEQIRRDNPWVAAQAE